MANFFAADVLGASARTEPSAVGRNVRVSAWAGEASARTRSSANAVGAAARGTRATVAGLTPVSGRETEVECGLNTGIDAVDAVQGERFGQREPAAGEGVGPVVAEHAVQQGELAGLVHARGARLHDLLAERQVAEQPALVAPPDLRAVGELAGLADVVQKRGGEQEVLVESRVELAGLVRELGHRDGVLEQSPEVGVVAAAAARRAAKRGAQGLVLLEHGGEQGAHLRLAHLARERVEEPVELVEVPVGYGQERGRVGLLLPRAADG